MYVRTSPFPPGVAASIAALLLTRKRMDKFLVLYLAPASVLEEWKKTEAKERKVAEQKMRSEWREWMKEHEHLLADTTAGVGKTTRITTSEVAESANDIMLYSIATGESREAVAKAFAGHPHLQIPRAWIEVMTIAPLS